jgi:hypothetical protein
MDVKRAGALLATAAAFALASTAAAGAAPGDTVLEGTTTEGVKVKLTVAKFGNATAFRVGGTDVTCAEGGTLTNRGGTYRDFDRSDPGEFFDKRRSSNNRGGYHFQTKSTITGEVNADGETWSGSIKLITKVFQHGDRIDTCALKTAWSTA